jgi:ATP-binding cassette subfamily B protein/subfamily B ATP-binding cassette protein MsbA
MKSWSGILRVARPQVPALATLVLLSIVGIALEVLVPWPLKLIVDHVFHGMAPPPIVAAVLPADPSQALLRLVLGMLLIFLTAQAVLLLRGYFQAGLSARMQFALGAKLFDQLQALSLVFHGKSRKGDLLRRVTTDTDCLPSLVTAVTLPAITSVVTLIILASIMWQLDARLALVASLVAIPIAVMMRAFAPRMSAREFQHQEAEGEVWSVAEQSLSALPVVQAFGREEHEGTRFRGVADRSMQAYVRIIVAQLQFKAGVDSSEAFGIAVVMFVGGMQVLNGAITLGTLIVFLSYLSSLYAPLRGLAYLSSSYATAAASARRLKQVLDSNEMVRECAGARELPVTVARGAYVRLEKVSFGYEPGRPVLSGIDLELTPGQMTALVGATGAGKTTMVSLLPRLFDPSEGRVLIDGVDLRDLTLASVRSAVAMVLQDPFLLPLSIAENIAYGRPDATREEIRAAATAANVDEFVDKLHGHRRARHHALWRPAAAHCHRPRSAQERTAPRSGRADKRPRRRHGRIGHKRARAADVGTHDSDHCPPPVHHPARRLCRRTGSRARRRKRQPSGTAALRRAVSEAAPGPGASRQYGVPLVMRLALISQEYPPETAHGGIATQTHGKAHGLAALGHDVHVISCSIDGDRHEYNDGRVRVSRIPGYEGYSGDTETGRWLHYSAAVAAELEALHAHAPFDLADFPEWGAEAYISLKSQALQIPVTVHLQGPLVMLANTIGWPEKNSELFRLGTQLEGECITLADAVLSSSRCTADWCAKHYGIRSEIVPVIHAGVDSRAFRPNGTAKQTQPTVLFVGRAAKSKGIDTLVEAACLVAREIPELKLRIVGRVDKELAAALAEQAARRGFVNLIDFAGFVAHDDLPEEFGHADIFAAPSRYEGGPGFVYLEAMACGLPVIACSGSGVAEIIDDGRTGILVPPNAAQELAASLHLLLANPELRRSMGVQARDYVVTEADSRVCARRFEDFYRSVIENAR